MSEIPTIEPFQFIRSTAFSERVQLANKLNEVIDAVNNIGDLPDLESQITEINSKISELEESIGNTDTSLAELENQVNALISEVNTTIKQAISALESDVDGIDTRLTTAEGTISEHGTEIDGLLKEVVDGVAMMSNPHGTIQVQINHEDGSNDISAPIDLGLVEQGGIVLQSGTTDRSFKLIVNLTDGTSWQTNDFVIPEGGGTDVSVTNISIAQGTASNMIQVKIGLSDGSTISSNDWTVVTPAEFSALGTRVTTAEGNITKNTGDISDLETRVQAIEDSPGFTLQPATATALGGVKIGANVKVQADGTISVDLSSYALKSEIPDVSQFVTQSELANDLSDYITAEDVAASYQPKGDYLTEIPIGGTAIGGVKNGGNVLIESDGTMNVVENDPFGNLVLFATSKRSNSSIGNYAAIILMAIRNDLTTTPECKWQASPSYGVLPFFDKHISAYDSDSNKPTRFACMTLSEISSPNNADHYIPANQYITNHGLNYMLLDNKEYQISSTVTPSDFDLYVKITNILPYGPAAKEDGSEPITDAILHLTGRSSGEVKLKDAIYFYGATSPTDFYLTPESEITLRETEPSF